MDKGIPNTEIQGLSANPKRNANQEQKLKNDRDALNDAKAVISRMTAMQKFFSCPK